jgi:hypothetical protein
MAALSGSASMTSLKGVSTCSTGATQQHCFSDEAHAFESTTSDVQQADAQLLL